MCVWFRYLDTQKLDRDLLRCAQHMRAHPGLTSVEFRAAAAQPLIGHLFLGARNLPMCLHSKREKPNISLNKMLIFYHTFSSPRLVEPQTEFHGLNFLKNKQTKGMKKSSL